MLTALLLGVTLFVATNIDDIFLLLAFFADSAFRAREVVLGQFAGLAVLVLASVVAALVALVIPPAYIGFLGIAPIVIGLKELLESWRGEAEEEDAGHRSAGSGLARIVVVAAVTIANGGDNVGVYIPVFAVRPGDETAIIIAVFAVMTFLWCALAYWMVNHRSIGAPIRRYGHRVLPFVLIALGVWIFHEAGTLDLIFPGGDSVA